MTQVYRNIGTKITVVQNGQRKGLFGAQGLMDKARQIAQTRGIEAARQAAYGTMMTYEFQIPTQDEILVNSGSTVINGLILKTAGTGRNVTYSATEGTGDLSVELDDVKINVSRDNKIVDTTLLKRSGTIKEFIQHGDFVIEVSGTVRTNSKRTFPTADLQELSQIFEQGVVFDVASVYLESFGINRVVLSRFTFDQQNMRFFNVLPFTLTLKSDTDYDFLVEE